MDRSGNEIVVGRRQFSPLRKLVFYGGYLFMAGGLVLCLAAAIPVLSGSLSFTPGFLFSLFVRALAGMALVGLGLFLRRLGILGPAGSVLVLDAQRARADLEPWSRAAGGLLDAALSEVDAKRLAGRPPEILVRCPRCGALNDEAARYCDQCGGRLTAPDS